MVVLLGFIYHNDMRENIQQLKISNIYHSKQIEFWTKTAPRKQPGTIERPFYFPLDDTWPAFFSNLIDKGLHIISV